MNLQKYLIEFLTTMRLFLSIKTQNIKSSYWMLKNIAAYWKLYIY